MSAGDADKLMSQLCTELTATSFIGFAEQIKQDVFGFETLGAELRRCSGMVSRDPAARAEITVAGEGTLHRLVCTSAGLGFEGTLISEPGFNALRRIVTTHKLALTDQKVGAEDGEYVIKFLKSGSQI